MTKKVKFFRKDKGSDQVLHEVEIEYLDKYKMWVRPGTSDKKMILECLKDYPEASFKGKTILDLGANIGGFSTLAIRGGAKQVIAVEPDEYNFEMLSKNVMEAGAEMASENSEQSYFLIPAACIAGDDKEITFYLNGSGNSACSASINKLRGAVSSKTVQAVKFADLLDNFKPSFIKMDVEGAEYELMETDLPDYVKEIAIELHGFRKAQKPLMKALLAKMESEWTCIYKDVQIVFGGESLILAHFARD